MTGEARRVKATVLGGLAASAAFAFGFFFVGVAWYFAALFLLGDHRTADDPIRHVPTAVFVLGLLASSLVAGRFGWKVGEDWYHTGRG